MTRTFALLTTTFALLLTSPAFAASERHASPGGSGSTCSAAAPCSIEQAFSGASSGDQIVLAGGDYGSPAAPLGQLYDDWRALTVRGPVTGTRARIYGNDPGGVLALASPGSSLSWVDVVQTGDEGSGFWGNLGTIDHVRVWSSGGSGIGLSNGTPANVVIKNTSVYAEAEGGWGISLANVRSGATSPINLVLRNVTIVAEHVTSLGLWIYTNGLSGSVQQTTASIHNSIVRGGTADVSYGAYSATSTTSVTIDHSNLAVLNGYGVGSKSATPVTENGNQTADPVFVDRAAGDIRQALGSPTINAGLEDPLAGLTDVEGDARVVDGLIDIGADEYVTPPPPPPVDPGSGDGDTGSGSGSASGDPVPATSGSPAPPAAPAAPAAPRPAPAAAATCLVPKLAGKTLRAARAALAKAGCAPGKVTKRRSHRIGKVIAQRARPGKRLAAGTRIALVVGRR